MPPRQSRRLKNNHALMIVPGRNLPESSRGQRPERLAEGTVTGKKSETVWIVRVSGRFYEVKSPRPLHIGDRIILRMVPNPLREQPSGKALPFEGRIAGPLNRFPPALNGIVEAFMRTGIQIPGIKDLEKLMALLPKGPNERKYERLASICREKGMEPTSDLLRDLGMYLLPESPGDRDGGGSRHQRQRKELREILCRAGGGDGEALHLFNHLPGATGQWLMLPFKALINDLPIRGTVNCFIPAGSLVADKFSVLVLSGESRWGFSWPIGGPDASLKIYTNRDPHRIMPLVKDLSTKLRKIGLKIDDTINNWDEFDGFPNSGAGLMHVDELL
jgi:hypothetical protein